MRPVILAMIFMAIMIPQVQAVGVGTFTDYSGGFAMDRGDEIELDFTLRGDDVEHENVVFFISADGGLEFDGDDLFEEEYDLNEYEDVQINIDMRAETEGLWRVEWGFREEPGIGAFDIESVTTNSFDVEIEDDGDSNNNDDTDGDFDILVDPDTGEITTSSRGGRGGGGGGSFSAAEEEKVYDEYGLWYDANGTAFTEDGLEIDQEYEDFLKLSTEDQEVILQDTTPQGSALTGAVVDDSDDSLLPALAGAQPKGEISADQGFLAIVLVLGILAVLFTFGAANYVGREGRK